MKIFLALEIPSEVTILCQSLQRQIRNSCIASDRSLHGMIFVKPEFLHITVKAPMQMNEEQLVILSERIKNLRLSSLKICTTAVQFFNENKLLIWLGAEAQGLKELSFMINQVLEPYGFDHDFRSPAEYKGHITLVRNAACLNTQALIERLNESISQYCFLAERIYIKESLVENGETVYKDLGIVELV